MYRQICCFKNGYTWSQQGICGWCSRWSLPDIGSKSICLMVNWSFSRMYLLTCLPIMATGGWSEACNSCFIVGCCCTSRCVLVDGKTCIDCMWLTNALPVITLMAWLDFSNMKVFYFWVSVHHKSIIYNKPTRCNSGSIVFINPLAY